MSKKKAKIPGLGLASDQLRRKVAAGRTQFKDDKGNVLDLTYITERVVAMSFPGSGLDVMFRNDIDQVARMLKQYHGDNFMVLNLCEQTYQYEKFNNQVLTFPFPDHHNPPLDTLISVVLSMNSWLTADEKHVVAVHCKGGKGRTGTVIATYLLLSGLCDTADEAVEYFVRKRLVDSKKSIKRAGQRRYIGYVHSLISGQNKPTRKVYRLKRVVMTGVPVPKQNKKTRTCRPALKIFSTQHPRRLIYSSEFDNPREYSEDDSYIMWNIASDTGGEGVLLAEDVTFYCYHVPPKSREEEDLVVIGAPDTSSFKHVGGADMSQYPPGRPISVAKKLGPDDDDFYLIRPTWKTEEEKQDLVKHLLEKQGMDVSSLESMFPLPRVSARPFDRGIRARVGSYPTEDVDRLTPPFLSDEELEVVQKLMYENGSRTSSNSSIDDKSTPHIHKHRVDLARSKSVEQVGRVWICANRARYDRVHGRDGEFGWGGGRGLYIGSRRLAPQSEDSVDGNADASLGTTLYASADADPDADAWNSSTVETPPDKTALESSDAYIGDDLSLGSEDARFGVSSHDVRVAWNTFRKEEAEMKRQKEAASPTAGDTVTSLVENSAPMRKASVASDSSSPTGTEEELSRCSSEESISPRAMLGASQASDVTACLSQSTAEFICDELQDLQAGRALCPLGAGCPELRNASHALQFQHTSRLAGDDTVDALRLRSGISSVNKRKMLTKLHSYEASAGDGKKLALREGLTRENEARLRTHAETMRASTLSHPVGVGIDGSPSTIVTVKYRSKTGGPSNEKRKKSTMSRATLSKLKKAGAEKSHLDLGDNIQVGAEMVLFWCGYNMNFVTLDREADRLVIPLEDLDTTGKGTEFPEDFRLALFLENVTEAHSYPETDDFVSGDGKSTAVGGASDDIAAPAPASGQADDVSVVRRNLAISTRLYDELRNSSRTNTPSSTAVRE